MPEPAKVQAFLEEIAAVCQKHNLALSYEYGDIAVVPCTDDRIRALRNTAVEEDLFAEER